MMTMTDPPSDPSRFRRALPDDAVMSSWTAADGWSLRRFDWPSHGKASRGSILFQGGRGDIIEKYLEAMTHWHDAGWAVTSFDWRGQGGSGRTTADPHVGHAVSFAPFIDDLAALWREWRTTAPGPHVVMGHSMGGHLVLRAMAEQAIDPDAAVLIAPMLGLRSPVGLVWGERLARVMRSLGDAARPAWKGHERPGAIDRQPLLTKDKTRYEDELHWYRTVPALRLGPPSWAWLVEAFASTRRQRTDLRLRAMTTPILMLIADADALVDPRAADDIAAALPEVEVLRFGDESAHEILREADGVRDRALGAVDAFLDLRAPPR